MPYIDAAAVRTKRAAIRTAFPRKDGWKVSVTKSRDTGVLVVFQEGPIPLTAQESGCEQVNLHYIDRFAVSPAAADVLKKAKSLANTDNYTVVESIDYGNVPKFYVNIQVGQWDRPYRVTTA